MYIQSHNLQILAWNVNHIILCSYMHVYSTVGISVTSYNYLACSINYYISIASYILHDVLAGAEISKSGDEAEYNYVYLYELEMTHACIQILRFSL